MWWSEPLPARRDVRWPRATLLAGLVLVLAGCGFQVRGAPRLPSELATTYIETRDRYSSFYRELTTVLRQNAVTLTDDPASARSVIRVINDDTGRRLLSVSTGNVPTEYEVWYRVRFAVAVDGQEVVPAEQLALSRDYSFDEFEVLGKSREEAIIRDALARDLVSLVTRRLSRIQVPAVPAPPAPSATATP